MTGWWFAPVVGGEQVWAFHPANSATPPVSGWKVPWRSVEPDNSVIVEPDRGGMAAHRMAAAQKKSWVGIGVFERHNSSW